MKFGVNDMTARSYTVIEHILNTRINYAN